VSHKEDAFVYILECSDGSYYTGWSTNVSRRLATHNSGHGSKYTRLRRPVRLAYTEPQLNRSDAMKREAQIKRWSRARKESLVRSTYVEKEDQK